MQNLRDGSTLTMTCRIAILQRFFAAALCLVVAIPVQADSIASTAAAKQQEIEIQRRLFRDALEPAERGDWSVIEKLPSADRQLLQQYVLWPDLQSAFWRATMSKTPPAEIEAFLRQYGKLRPVRELRYHLALHLARNGDLRGYQQIYERYYQGQGIAKLDCLSLQAELEANRPARVNERAKELWLIGISQVGECDPVFDYLRRQNLLTTDLYRARYELAIEAREFQLAQWLAKSIDQQHVEEARLWIQAGSKPEEFLRNYSHRTDAEVARKQLVYAAERLTYRDPNLANSAWSAVNARLRFTDEQRHQTARHIALWTARDNLPDAYSRLLGLPDEVSNKEVRYWRARTSLRNAAWDNLLADISVMTEEERTSEEWQYWRAVALQRLGQVLAARQIFQELAEERSYYGFLAADEVDENYAMRHSQLAADEVIIAALASRPDIVRARELFMVGQDSRGRSEWDAVIRTLGADGKKQAAILADRWGWHSQAISAAASLGEYDDLSLRYPLPYQQLFEQSATAASISPTWAYGIARSESLFMPDVRSRAGAVGLMQLMPATGREVARQMRLPYSGLNTLTSPASNIRLGTGYLGQMAERYGGNAVLATAAYNAGPHRVDRWLPDSGSIDARIWIENIPFNETRKYVKRVLSAQTIFHWRMTGELRRLSDELLLVRAARDARQLAAR
jgi:soluble lytic murein transglycosylase